MYHQISITAITGLLTIIMEQKDLTDETTQKEIIQKRLFNNGTNDKFHLLERRFTDRRPTSAVNKKPAKCINLSNYEQPKERCNN